jgi:membrane-bound lytic murein transglycosylase B
VRRSTSARGRELAVRLCWVLGVTVVVVAVIAWMRQSDADAPPPRMAATVQIDAAGGPPPTREVSGGSPTDRVDPVWAERVARTAGIPARALLAYASADLTIDGEKPGCGLGWNTVAAIGAIESVHGTIAGSQLGSDGRSTPAVRGPALDGDGFAAIADSDDGAWDGDTRWDRAVGPMQFIPATWARWGADGNGDGVADPNQIDDAALATARYLCASGSVEGSENWRDAVFSYNHLESYVDDVAAVANRYATAG